MPTDDDDVEDDDDDDDEVVPVVIVVVPGADDWLSPTVNNKSISTSLNAASIRNGMQVSFAIG